MIETIKREWSAKVALLIFILFTFWWVLLQTSLNTDLNKQLFGAYYGAMAMWGALWGVIISQNWGSYKSVMGKILIFFALGLFLQEFGQLAYSFYTYFLHVDIPYPSWGDIGYFGSIPAYIYGVVLLAKASGVKIALRSNKTTLQAITIPLVILVISYMIFLNGYQFDWSKPLNILLDFGYPLGQAIYISLALLTYLLSRKVLGGIMRSKILFVLFALFVQYIADYVFLFQAKQGTAAPGGIIDFTYLCAYLLMTLALIQFNTVAKSLKNQ